MGDLATMSWLASKGSGKNCPSLSRLFASPQPREPALEPCLSHACPRYRASSFGEAEEPLVPQPHLLLSLLLTQHPVRLVSVAAAVRHLQGEPKFIGLIPLPILPPGKEDPHDGQHLEAGVMGAPERRGEKQLGSGRERMIAELCVS